MIKGGTGGANTQTGLCFESRCKLATALAGLTNYSVIGASVFYKGEKVAELFSKNRLYSNLLASLGVDYQHRISKKLLPDEALLVGNRLFIIEIKFQVVSGSVDEKLQTCHFKKHQYAKLFSGTGIEVEYIYVLNDWFKHLAYTDTLEYIKAVGCHYFFNNIPLDFLGLATD